MTFLPFAIAKLHGDIEIRMLSERAPICNHNVCLFCLHCVSDCADSALNEAAGVMNAAVFGLSVMSGM